MKKFFLPLMILAGAVLLSVAMFLLKPAPMKLDAPEPSVAVETEILHRTQAQLMVESQGTVMPRTRTSLIAEVSGVVLKVSPAFVVGGVFNAGDLLLQLDPTDYEVALQRAEARLISVQAQLTFEKARSVQAAKEWSMTGRPASEAPLLALREPYLAEAEANLLEAQAEVKQAKKKLAKTTIRAPYTGMVADKSVDIGQFVTIGARMGETFAIDVAEIRLPLTTRDLSMMNPLASPVAMSAQEVILKGSVAGKPASWRGLLTRSEGVVDERNRAQYVVVDVVDPYNTKGVEDRMPLLMGTFVTAMIKGKQIDDVFAVPRHALLEGGNVATVDSENRLRLKKVEAVYSDDEFYFVRTGLEEGVEIIVSAVGVAIEGMRVSPERAE